MLLRDAYRSLKATPLLSAGSLLYGLHPRDPVTIATAAATMALFAGTAAWLPARRAARNDPALVLREG
jgi:ABC-type lipoprotein release transport system permease subunit